MIRLLFYVEGQAEQGYVKRALTPHLAPFGVQVMGPVLAASGKKTWPSLSRRREKLSSDAQ
jgi:hypothetical protein